MLKEAICLMFLKSSLNQYVYLIKKLSNYYMDKDSLKQLYEHLMKDDNFATANVFFFNDGSLTLLFS